MRREQQFGRRVRAIAAVGALLGATACDVPRFSFPRPRSLQAEAILKLWQGAFIAAAIIGFFVVGLILWCVFRYRARPGDDATTIPVQTEYVIPLEIAYTAIPVVIIAVLSGFTYATQRTVEKRATAPLVIQVKGSQWQWQFRYPASNVSIIGGTVTQNGDTLPTLVLPVDEPVRIVLTSADVVHAFWVPDFLFKKDNIPGRNNEFDVTATEVGEYVGRCAEFCGLEHDRMTFRVKVVPAGQLGAALTDAGAK